MPEARDAAPQRSEEEQKRIEMQRSAELQKFGYAGLEELARLQNEQQELVEAVEQDPADEQLKGALELNRKRLELFHNERDNAGAFKFKRFGREMRGAFEDRPDQPKVIGLDKETGRMTLAEGEKDRRMLFVNMGELDRFNKEGGGHAAGDAALAETAMTIEKVVRAKLMDKAGKRSGYQLLRYSGNEFMVSFSEISQDDLDDITEALNQARPGEGIGGVKEGAPLAAVSFELGEAVEIVNQLEVELTPDEKISNPDEANRELIDVMRQRANYALDLVKFETRVDRIREKLKTEDRAGVQKFFDNYMAKMFKGTPLDSLDRFAELDGLSEAEAEVKVGKLAFEATKQRLAFDKDKNDLKEGLIDARVKAIRERTQKREAGPARLIGPMPQGEARLAEVPAETEGQRLLRAKREAAEQGPEGGADEYAAEIAKLEYQIETARRDQGTGLLERGVHYEALEEKFKSGEKTSLVFVDMGFLKYFDQKGGADVGDSALKMAAELMTRAIAEAGVKGEAYRYGGDEFTVQIEGGQAEIVKFQEKLQELRVAAGAIDVGKKGTRDDYYPTELVFNYGAADMDMANEAFESLKEAGIYDQAELSDPDRVASLKTELMTVIADKSIEAEKAINRFALLIDKIHEVSEIKDQVRAEQARRQVNEMITFSSKAIFGEAGGAAKLTEWALSSKDPEEVRTEIEAWVSEQIEGTREREKGQKDLREQLVELHVRVWYYQQEIGRLTKLGTEQAGRIDHLEKEKDQAVKERQALLDVRRKLE